MHAENHPRTETSAFCEQEANVVAEPYSEATDELGFLRAVSEAANTRAGYGSLASSPKPGCAGERVTAKTEVTQAGATGSAGGTGTCGAHTPLDGLNSADASHDCHHIHAHQVLSSESGDKLGAGETSCHMLLSPVDDALLGTQTFGKDTMEEHMGALSTDNDGNERCNAPMTQTHEEAPPPTASPQPLRHTATPVNSTSNSDSGFHSAYQFPYTTAHVPSRHVDALHLFRRDPRQPRRGAGDAEEREDVLSLPDDDAEEDTALDDEGYLLHYDENTLRAFGYQSDDDADIDMDDEGQSQPSVDRFSSSQLSTHVAPNAQPPPRSGRPHPFQQLQLLQPPPTLQQHAASSANMSGTSLSYSNSLPSPAPGATATATSATASFGKGAPTSGRHACTCGVDGGRSAPGDDPCTFTQSMTSQQLGLTGTTSTTQSGNATFRTLRDLSLLPNDAVGGGGGGGANASMEEFLRLIATQVPAEQQRRPFNAASPVPAHASGLTVAGAHLRCVPPHGTSTRASAPPPPLPSSAGGVPSCGSARVHASGVHAAGGSSLLRAASSARLAATTPPAIESVNPSDVDGDDTEGVGSPLSSAQRLSPFFGNTIGSSARGGGGGGGGGQSLPSSQLLRAAASSTHNHNPHNQNSSSSQCPSGPLHMLHGSSSPPPFSVHAPGVLFDGQDVRGASRASFTSSTTSSHHVGGAHPHAASVSQAMPGRGRGAALSPLVPTTAVPPLSGFRPLPAFGSADSPSRSHTPSSHVRTGGPHAHYGSTNGLLVPALGASGHGPTWGYPQGVPVVPAQPLLPAATLPSITATAGASDLSRPVPTNPSSNNTVGSASPSVRSGAAPRSTTSSSAPLTVLAAMPSGGNQSSHTAAYASPAASVSVSVGSRCTLGAAMPFPLAAPSPHPVQPPVMMMGVPGAMPLPHPHPQQVSPALYTPQGGPASPAAASHMYTSHNLSGSCSGRGGGGAAGSAGPAALTEPPPHTPSLLPFSSGSAGASAGAVGDSRGSRRGAVQHSRKDSASLTSVVETQTGGSAKGFGALSSSTSSPRNPSQGNEPSARSLAMLSPIHLRHLALVAMASPLLLVGLAGNMSIQRKHTNVHGSLAGVVDYFSYTPNVAAAAAGQPMQMPPSAALGMGSSVEAAGSSAAPTTIILPPFFNHNKAGIDLSAPGVFPFLFTPNAATLDAMPAAEGGSATHSAAALAAAAAAVDSSCLDLSTCTVYPIFIQMFPCELRERAMEVLNRVTDVATSLHALEEEEEEASASASAMLTGATDAGGATQRGAAEGKSGIVTRHLVRGRVLQIEPRSETSFIALVATNNIRRLVYILRCRVLLDRYGFYYCKRFGNYLKMKEYCETVRRLPQQSRHFQTDGLPCMPLVVELARSFQPSPATTTALALATASHYYAMCNAAAAAQSNTEPSAIHQGRKAPHRVQGDRSSSSAGMLSAGQHSVNSMVHPLQPQHQQQQQVLLTAPRLATAASAAESDDPAVPRCFDEIVPMAAVDRHRSRNGNNSSISHNIINESSGNSNSTSHRAWY